MMLKISGIYERDFTCVCHVGSTDIFPFWLNQPNWVSYRVIALADGYIDGCLCVSLRKWNDKEYRNGEYRSVAVCSRRWFYEQWLQRKFVHSLNKWYYKINTMNLSFSTWCFTLNEKGLWKYKRPVTFRLVQTFRRNLLPPSLGHENDGLLQIVD